MSAMQGTKDIVEDNAKEEHNFKERNNFPLMSAPRQEENALNQETESGKQIASKNCQIAGRLKYLKSTLMSVLLYDLSIDMSRNFSVHMIPLRECRTDSRIRHFLLKSYEYMQHFRASEKEEPREK